MRFSSLNFSFIRNTFHRKDTSESNKIKKSKLSFEKYSTVENNFYIIYSMLQGYIIWRKLHYYIYRVMVIYRSQKPSSVSCAHYATILTVSIDLVLI